MLFNHHYSAFSSYWVSASSSLSSFSIQKPVSYCLTDNQIQRILSVASTIFSTFKSKVPSLGDRQLTANTKIVLLVGCLSIMAILALEILRRSRFSPFTPFKGHHYDNSTDMIDSNSFKTSLEETKDSSNS